MFQFQGIWLPDGEKHFPLWMEKNGELIDGRGSYQIRKLREAMKWVKQWRVAVDIGAHVGLWSMHLARRFKFLHAFEPVPEFRECWAKNMNGGETLLYPYALGERAGRVKMRIDPADTGGTHVAEVSDDGGVEMRRLDDFDFSEVDFVKVDAEGYEHQILLGAKETLLNWRPCVIVEQKPRILGKNFGVKGTPAVDFLRELGMVQRAEIGGDYVLSWK